MITVEEAEKIILAEIQDYGAEITPLEHSLGRVLAENINAGNNIYIPAKVVTADGIAISYGAIETGTSSFHIKITQPAGDTIATVHEVDHCVEIIAGTILPGFADTVIPYEDLEIRAGIASLLVDHHVIKKGNNVHHHGQSGEKDGLIAGIGQLITPAMINLIAAVGETELRVKKIPKVVIISSGNNPAEQYTGHAVNAILQQNGIEATVPQVSNDAAAFKKQLIEYLQIYDVLLLYGNAFESIEQIQDFLAEQQIKYLFNEVQQLPGKLFRVGKSNGGKLIFVFPNDIPAVNMCLQRYFVPWFQATLGIKNKPDIYAVLAHDVYFQPELKYFLQIELIINEKGKLIAHPIQYANDNRGYLTNLNAFMELPAGKHNFKKDEIYKVYPISRVV